MPYKHFDLTKPDGSTQTGPAVTQSLRDNQVALRDMIMAGAVGFNYSISAGAGSVAKPQFAYWKRGSEWIRSTLTWGTSGGAADSVTVAVYDYSADGGASWAAVGTKTHTYDASGNLVSSVWS